MGRFGFTKTVVLLIRIISLLYKTTFMKRSYLIRFIPVLILIAALVITGISWQKHPTTTNKKAITDTIPDRKKKIRDIDEAIEELDKGKVEVDKSLNNIDWPKINADIKMAMDNINVNMDEIKANVAASLKDIDVNKIHAEVQQALKEVDAAKIQADVAASLKEINVEKIKADVQASIDKIDWDQIKVDIDKAKNIDMKKLETEMRDMKPEIEKSMKEAHESIEKAKKELQEYKSFINELDKDGLINKKEDYKIEYNNGVLTINGKKQSEEVANKYSGFLKGHTDFVIKKNEDGFNINNPHHRIED
jgi:hypothetical protein